jgi:hypothetical protein
MNELKLSQLREATMTTVYKQAESYRHQTTVQNQMLLAHSFGGRGLGAMVRGGGHNMLLSPQQSASYGSYLPPNPSPVTSFPMGDMFSNQSMHSLNPFQVSGSSAAGAHITEVYTQSGGGPPPSTSGHSGPPPPTHGGSGLPFPTAGRGPVPPTQPVASEYEDLYNLQLPSRSM